MHALRPIDDPDDPDNRMAIMLAGAPGSGKSTLAEHIRSTHTTDNTPYIIVSADRIRQELCGDAKDQSRNPEVWERVYEKTQQRISEGATIILDATWANKKQRVEAVLRLRRMGASTIVAVQLDARIDTCLERKTSRDRIVPLHAVYRIWNDLREDPLWRDRDPGNFRAPLYDDVFRYNNNS